MVGLACLHNANTLEFAKTEDVVCDVNVGLFAVIIIRVCLELWLYFKYFNERKTGLGFQSFNLFNFLFHFLLDVKE